MYGNFYTFYCTLIENNWRSVLVQFIKAISMKLWRVTHYWLLTINKRYHVIHSMLKSGKYVLKRKIIGNLSSLNDDAIFEGIFQVRTYFIKNVNHQLGASPCPTSSVVWLRETKSTFSFEYAK